MPSIVVIGYGNPLRGDDAIGWKAAEALRDVYEDDTAVEVFASHQLNPEMAESVAEAGMVIFIDAVADTLLPGTLRVRACIRRTTHQHSVINSIHLPCWRRQSTCTAAVRGRR